MPIVKNGEDVYIEYQIPKEIKEKMDEKFMEQLQFELHMIFGLALDDLIEDSCITYNGGTAGWNTAFALACIKTNNDDIYKYYRTLDWYDSDIFDGEVEVLFDEYKMCINKTKLELVLENTKYKEEDLCECYRCGKILPKRYFENSIEHKDIDDEEYKVCKHCLENEKSENKNANNYYLNGIKEIEKHFDK